MKQYRIGIVQVFRGETYQNALGDFRIVHTRFSRWAKAGIWQKVFEVLSHESDDEYAMLDSSIVRAHQHSARKKEQAIGRSKGDLSTKIHSRTDAFGNPTGFISLLGRIMT